MNTHLFGQTMRAARKAAKFSQNQLGIILGVGQPYISKVENGEEVPTARIILEWAHATNTRSGILFEALDDTIAQSSVIFVNGVLTDEQFERATEYANSLAFLNEQADIAAERSLDYNAAAIEVARRRHQQHPSLIQKKDNPSAMQAIAIRY